MYKQILVADVIVRERTVTMPLICPHCLKDLVKDKNGTDTVVVEQLDETSNIASPDMEYDGEFDYGYQEDSSTWATLDVICVRCDKSVLTNPGTITTERIDHGRGTHQVGDTVVSQVGG